MSEPIQLWRFHEAPKHYRDLSDHGGDEDWLAFVPSGVRVPDWIYEPGTGFGICDVSERPVLGGTVFIGAHA